MNILGPFSRLGSDFRASWELSNPQTRRLLKVTIMTGVLAAFIEYAFAISLQHFFKFLGYFTETETGFESMRISSGSTLWFLLFIAVVRSLSDGFKIYVSRLAQQRFAQFIRLKLINLALNNAGAMSSAKVISLFSDETNRASVSILNIATICIHAALALSLLGISFVNFPQATVVGMSLLIICYVPLKLYERKSSQEGIFLSEEWEKTNYVLTEGIRNNFYLKLIGMIGDEVNRANSYLSRYLEKYKKAFFLISLRTSLPSLFAIFILVSIAYIHKSNNFFGNEFKFLEFFYIFLRFTQAISQTVTSVGDLRINAESTFRLKQWLEENHLKESEAPQQKIVFDELTLKAESLTFGFDEKKFLKDISFNLKQGDILVITGESGTGKSTLLQLLLGLLDPDKGEVLVSGHKLKTARYSLIDEIAYVGPHAFLVEGSLKENLLYGNRKPITENDLAEALQRACLSRLISELPEGIHTSLNEIGSRLSTGQKQRLMIARAYLRKPKLLIFDEATSNLDEQTEKEVVQNFIKFVENKVAITVSHRNAFNKIATQRLNLT